MNPLARRIPLIVVTLLAALAAPSSGQTRETFTFEGVTLKDGSSSEADASIQVRVKESPGGGYTRADYFDARGRRLGFFEVVARDESALRAWAVTNFPDRTGGGR